MTTLKPIAVVLGVGAEAGLGAAMCRRAAWGGCHVVVGGRTQAKIDAIAAGLTEGGATATALRVDVTEEDSVNALFAAIDEMPGELALTVYNAGNAFSGDSLTLSTELFESAWRVCCLGGFLTAREAGKRMVDQGHGTIVFTGATASLKARPPFLPFASAKAGLRAVAANYARDLGPKGVHVAHVIIDGGIDGERLNAKAPDLKEKMGAHGMLDPDAIAESYWMLHQQHRSAWSFEIDLRPFKETF
ncbi:MAG: SDR family NAD(P)-dependent oxidoreductase [Pseudomonadota bacterium]